MHVDDHGGVVTNTFGDEMKHKDSNARSRTVFRLRTAFLGGLGVAAFACGPAGDEVSESIASDASALEYGFIDRAPDRIRHLSRSALDAVDLHSGAVTAIDVGTKLLEVFGLIGSGPSELEVLSAELNARAGELSWHMWGLSMRRTSRATSTRRSMPRATPLQ